MILRIWLSSTSFYQLIKKSNAYALLLVVFIVGRMSILSFEISFSTLIHVSRIPYLRFLENQIRKAFVFEGTPIHLIARKRK